MKAVNQRFRRHVNRKRIDKTEKQFVDISEENSKIRKSIWAAPGVSRESHGQGRSRRAFPLPALGACSPAPHPANKRLRRYHAAHWARTHTKIFLYVHKEIYT